MDADNTQFGAGSGTTGVGNSGIDDLTTDTGANGGSGGAMRGIAGMARDAASQAQQKAGEQVRSTVDKGRTRAADTLNEVARTLMGQGGGEAQANEYLSKVGQQVQRAADYLQNTDPQRIARDAERLARQNPALFLGGAFAIGVLAARFLKSSRQDDDAYGPDGRLYDRERALSSYRDDAGDFDGPLGDDENDWPSGMGTLDGTTTGGGSLGGSTGSTGGYGGSGSTGYGATGGAASTGSTGDTDDIGGTGGTTGGTTGGFGGYGGSGTTR
jgi:hypothetical protein